VAGLDGRGTGPAPGVEVTRRSGPVPSRTEIEGALRAEGLTPRSWSNAAGFVYGRHVHGYRKVLYCLSGAIVFHTDSGDVALGPGDRMELLPGVEHGATVGDAGVQCAEASRP